MATVKPSMTMKEAITEWQNLLIAQGRKPNTVKAYTQTVNRAADCWGNIQPRHVTARHIQEYFATNDHWSAQTRNLHLENLKRFFAWCQAYRLVPRDHDPTFGWKNLRVEREQALRVPLAQFPALLDVAEHPRDRALIAVGLFLFLRGGELSLLRVKDYSPERMEMRVYREKLSRWDTMPVSSELALELDRWLRAYAQQMGTHTLNPDWFLIPTLGRPATVRHATGSMRYESGTSTPLPSQRLRRPYKVVQKALAALGYPVERTGEHTLRRSGARALFDELRNTGFDGALMRVASMLDHADTKMTERYIGVTLEKTQRNEQFAGETMFPSLNLNTPSNVLSIVKGGA